MQLTHGLSDIPISPMCSLLLLSGTKTFSFGLFQMLNPVVNMMSVYLYLIDMHLSKERLNSQSSTVTTAYAHGRILLFRQAHCQRCVVAAGDLTWRRAMSRITALRELLCLDLFCLSIVLPEELSQDVSTAFQTVVWYISRLSPCETIF